MHALGILFIAGPVIGLIFAVSLLLNVLLTWQAGWRIGRALAIVWLIWMAAAGVLQLAMGGDVLFSVDTYVLELALAAIGFLPAAPGAWIGTRLRRNSASQA